MRTAKIIATVSPETAVAASHRRGGPLAGANSQVATNLQILPLRLKGPDLNHLGLFAKFWEPGRVKTRLARTTGAVSASQVYLSFFQHLLSGLADVGESRTVAFSPENKRIPFAETVGTAWGLQPQQGTDLGMRMEHFFRWAHMVNGEQSAETDPSHVVVIGSDTPQLPVEFVKTAFEELENADVVLGPSTDGGYYLIGLKAKCYPVFENVEWSTSRVLQQTIDRTRELGLRYSLLPPLTDIDHFEDLVSLVKQLISHPERFASRDQNLLGAIQAVAQTDGSSGWKGNR